LAFASPSFFEGMFNLPQPTDGHSAGETKDGLPIILMTEKRYVLEKLLPRLQWSILLRFLHWKT
jgi:hypothetical protein